MLALYAFGPQAAFADQIPLERFVHDMGDKYNVWFTIEGSYAGNKYSNGLMVENVSVQGAPADIESVLFALTNSIPDLTVIADSTNKSVYHLIDKRLLGLDDYAMGVVLETIKFEGNAAAFVDHLKEKVPHLRNQEFSAGSVLFINAATAISIDEKAVSMRDALSNGISLRGYSRLVWTSFTSLESRETLIQFRGKAYASEH
jgi:hypothetical protein